MMRYLAWDFDGTLAKRPGMWSAAIAEAAAEEGVQVDASIIKPFIQQGFPWHSPDHIRPPDETAVQWWNRLECLFETVLIGAAGMSELDAIRAAKRVRSIYCDPMRWEIFEDAIPTLRRLSKDGWRHVILSNHVPELDELVSGLGLTSEFEAIFSSGRTGVEKPHPEAFKILRDYAGAGSRVVMVGDNWDADICGAISSGLEAILVRNSHSKASLSCPNLEGLQELLVNGEQD